VLANCVVFGNTPDGIADVNDSASTVTFSNIQGGFPGAGNIDIDPLFADPDGLDNTPGTPDDNLRVLESSPCIDAADHDAYVSAVDEPTDLDGNPRLFDDPSTVDTGVGSVAFLDMGAIEFSPDACFADGDIGLDDFALLHACFTGPDGELLPGCECFDFDNNDAVDLHDFGAFQVLFGGS